MNHTLTGHYNLQLVTLSVAIAILASYTSLDLAGRVKATRGKSQLGWLGGGAIAMGIGIWAMHFIGMLAFYLPIPVVYDFLTVILSILPAILASGFALFVLSHSTLHGRQLLGGSLLMGGGIAIMHYVGMAAMQLPAMMVYNWGIIAISILIAIGVSFVALSLAFRLGEEVSGRLWKKGASSVIMGMAIASMHYTGMAAVKFSPMGEILSDFPLTNHPYALLTIAVSLGTFIILILALLTAFFDRRLSAKTIQTQALEQSQKYLKNILQGIKVGVLVTDLDGKICLSNQALLRLLDLPESALKSYWQELLNCSDSSFDLQENQLALMLKNVRHNKNTENAVLRLKKHENLSQIWLLVNTVVLNIFDSKEEQIIWTFSEISDLKQAEESLKQSEAQFRNLAQQEELINRLSGQIRHSLKLDLILQTTVEAVRKQLDTDRVLIYKFEENWQGCVIVEDVIQPWSSIFGLMGNDYCFPTEYAQLYQEGRIQAIDNILEAKLDECHLKFLQGIQVQANLIVAVFSREELWGLLVVHHCRETRKWQEMEIELLKNLAVQLGIAIQQSELYTQAQENALKSQAQTQKLEETLAELQRAQVQLIQSEKMSSLGQLVAGIAHEINNPVNFIYGNIGHAQEYGLDLLNLVQLYQKSYPHPTPEIEEVIDLIDLDFLSEDLIKLLKSIKVGAERIREIVLSLRNFSRLDESEVKDVDIHQGIDNTLMILHHRLKEQPNRPEIQVIKDYGNLPLIECYAGQLNQVFMNLLSNAIDSLDERHNNCSLSELSPFPSQIVITTETTNSDMIVMRIKDNGTGIPLPVQEKIFNPFFTTKPVGKGTGMGLSISYQIVTQKHNGSLECVSEMNQGTEFIIKIPIHQKNL